MSQISKQALIVDNSQSFPNNNAGDITPSDLRGFNVNMIDSLVSEIPYQSFTASVTNSINLLNAFTQSQQPSFSNLNAFTASQLSINTGLNAATYSLNVSVNSLTSEVDQLQTWSGSVNQISSAGVSLGYATRFNFSGLMTASITPNVNGAIADISLLSDNTRVSTASFNAYTQSQATDFAAYSSSTATSLNSKVSLTTYNQFTQSTNTFTASASTSITQLLSFSASLDATYATDAQLASATASLINLIDTKLSTSSFNSYTQSINNTLSGINTGSYATTGSNSFTGSQIITGSVLGNITALSVNSNTASMDLSKSNFFTLQLVAGQNVRLEASNIKAGQTINLRLNQATASVGTISFPTYFDFPAANIASASAITGAVDILSFLTFDTNTIYSTIIKNLS